VSIPLNVVLRHALAPGAVVVVAGAAPFLTPSSAGAVTVKPGPWGSGAYAGAGASGTLASFGTWRGKTVAFASDYLPQDSWASLEFPTWLLSKWSGAGKALVLGVPMLPNVSGTSIPRGAAGAYDSHFKKLASTLVSYGYANASLRIGWEMNGTWYRWSAKPNPTAWKTYYRRIVTAMRSVPGQHFAFDWNMNLGSSSMPADQAYPGDAYVTYVGVDAYDWKWGDSSVTPQNRWKWILSQSYGLNWVAQFARAHGKRVTVPEWGLSSKSVMRGGGSGDDPYYVTSMISWVKAKGGAYEAYFNVNDSRIDNGRFPKGAGAYKTAVRGS
jgi:hypothetical protein